MQAPKQCLQSLSIFHQPGDFTVKSHESTILIGISDFCKGGTCLGITGKLVSRHFSGEAEWKGGFLL